MQENLINNENNICLSDKTDEFEYDFQKFSELEEFSLDEELLNKFKPIAKKLKLSQEQVEMLMDIAYQMSLKQDERYKNDESYKQESKLNSYAKEFDEDKSLPDKNSEDLRKYMTLADDAYNKFASPKLKEILVETKLIYCPEMIKMFHSIGELMQEDEMVFNSRPVVEELTPAQILYGKN